MSFDPLHDPTIPSQAPRYYQGRKMFGGRYTLTKRLGSGGMGVVWLAQDNELGIQRALKFAPPEVAADARSVAMLKREAIAGTSLAHPHIVRIFDFAQDTQAGETAVVMEVVEGKSLADLQAERIEATGNGYFEPEEIEPWLQQAAAALDYAHGESRAHRDLKPQNFMIETATGRLKIMDFGISRRIGDSHATLTGKDSSGTLPYMSPQQVLGDAPSSSDDIYGMGATLYDLLTGSPPFIGGDLPSQVREKPPTPLNQRRAEVNADAGNTIPAAWEQGVLACLSKRREDRPQSARAFHQFISQMQAKPEAAAESGPLSPLSSAPQAKPSAKTTQSTRSPHDASGAPHTSPPPLPLIGLSGPLWGAAALAVISLGAWALVSKPREVIKEVPRLAEDTAARQEAVQQRERAESLEKKAEEEEHKRLAAEAAAAKAKEETAKATMPPPVVLKAVPVGTPATTTKSLPFENSLGMKFVPVPIGAGESKGQRVLFSIWETRSKDYAAFVKATSHDAGDDWKTYIFKDFPVGRGMGENTEESNHPVANVSYNDAVVFCEWLTKKDRASGHIGPKDEYRLPTDTEWSLVVGIGDMEDASASPQDKDGKLTGIYPWGTSYPPPTGSGNYADTAAKTKFGGDWSIIEGYTDGYATTAPVGTFNANSLGLYDLGGNLWEWTSSAWETGSTSYVLRGGSWDSGAESSVLSSIRRDDSRDYRYYYGGFRCVLVVGGGSTSGKVKTSSDPTATSEFGGKSTSVTATIQGRPSKFVVARDPARATISLPYANSLDMLFVPVPETNVLFSVFETRGRDFARYPGSGTDEEIVTAMAGNWKECEYEGIAVGRGEGETAVTSHHPVVNVTWGDAKGFCDWLSAQDRKAGVSSQPSFNYRLPTDAEWSAAVGVADEPKELQSRNSSSALG